MEDSKVQQNLRKLEEIIKNNPHVTHVYFRTDDGRTVDVPIERNHAAFTARQHPNWEIISSNKQMDEEVENLFKEGAESSETDTSDFPEPTILPNEDPENPAFDPYKKQRPVAGVPKEETLSDEEDVPVPPKPSESKAKKKKAKKVTKKKVKK